MTLGSACAQGQAPFVTTDATPYEKVRVTKDTACALDEEGYLHCWGAAADAAPSDVQLADFDIQEEHGCAVTTDGAGTCWAWLEGLDPGRAAALAPPDGPVVAVATGETSTCWLFGNSSIACVGASEYLETVPPSAEYSLLAGGSIHYCGVTAGSPKLECWGYDGNGEVSEVPSDGVAAFDAGAGVTCVVSETGAAACFGVRQEDMFEPEGTFSSVSTYFDACFIDSDAALRCFVDDWSGCQWPDHKSGFVSVGYRSGCSAIESGGLLCWLEDPDRPGYPDACLVGEPNDLPWTE